MLVGTMFAIAQGTVSKDVRVIWRSVSQPSARAVLAQFAST